MRPKILASDMETVLERVKEQYDLVVIDTPPLTAVSDAFPLLGVIANGFKSGRLGSYGGYGYSYDYAQSRPEPPSGGEQPVSPGEAASASSPNGVSSPEQPIPTAKS